MRVVCLLHVRQCRGMMAIRVKTRRYPTPVSLCLLRSAQAGQ